jgi:hypothetical protein
MVTIVGERRTVGRRSEQLVTIVIVIVARQQATMPEIIVIANDLHASGQ